MLFGVGAWKTGFKYVDKNLTLILENPTTDPLLSLEDDTFILLMSKNHKKLSPL